MVSSIIIPFMRRVFCFLVYGSKSNCQGAKNLMSLKDVFSRNLLRYTPDTLERRLSSIITVCARLHFIANKDFWKETMIIIWECISVSPRSRLPLSIFMSKHFRRLRLLAEIPRFTTFFFSGRRRYGFCVAVDNTICLKSLQTLNAFLAATGIGITSLCLIYIEVIDWFCITYYECGYNSKTLLNDNSFPISISQ